MCILIFDGKLKRTPAQNTIISPNFLMWKFCGKAQFPHSFCDSPETMRKLHLSTKFPHQKIRCNYGVSRSEQSENFLHLEPVKCLFWQKSTKRSIYSLECFKLERLVQHKINNMLCKYLSKKMKWNKIKKEPK